jgi:hypothetical protein
MGSLEYRARAMVRPPIGCGRLIRSLIQTEAFQYWQELLSVYWRSIGAAGPHRAAKTQDVQIAPMDPLTLFGLFSVSAMLLFYALEHRSRWFVLAFAGACALGSVYGFLQGAWPFGLVEAIWCGVAARRWWQAD